MKKQDENGDAVVLTVEEARKLLRLSRGATYEAIRTKQIPSIRIGRRILVPRVRLNELLQGKAKT